MKHHLFCSIFFFHSIIASACDVCGSGPGNYYNGLLPQFRKHFIGLRFQQSHLQAHLGPDGRITYLSSRERSSVMEIWGGTQFGQKFRLLFSLPYTSVRRDVKGVVDKQSGPGDINLVGYYELVKPKDDRKSRQSLWIGGGIKLPAGRYDEEQENIGLGLQNNFQLGSGSVDFSMNLVHDISINNTGINTSLAYRLNTPNRYGYRYGNRMTANILLYHRIRLSEKTAVSPNAGILFENSSKDDKVKGIGVFNSGGHSGSIVGGLECSVGRVNIGTNFQQPVSQRIAEQRVKLDSRFMVSLSYSFP